MNNLLSFCPRAMSCTMTKQSHQCKQRDTREKAKILTKLVLKRNYKSYEELFVKFNLTSFDQRRDRLCVQWTRKYVKNENKFHIYFHSTRNTYKHNKKKQKYTVHNTNTERMMKVHTVRMKNKCEDQIKEKFIIVVKTYSLCKFDITCL